MPYERSQNETHASRAYQHLRQKLVLGVYQPGTRLLYGPIGKEIGVSATPVREAAGQLATEGLVELIPQIGAVVRSIDEAELRELYEVRILIEPYAAAQAAERATSEQLQLVVDQYDRMRDLERQEQNVLSDEESQKIVSRFNEADHLFHVHLVEATGNQTLVRTATQSNILTRVFGIWRHRHGVDVMKQVCDDHERILAAVQAKDAATAQAAASAHINKSLSQSLQSFANA